MQACWRRSTSRAWSTGSTPTRRSSTRPAAGPPEAAGVASGEGGDVTMVATQAGAVGLIYDKEEFPDGVDSWADLFDPAYAGRVALDGGYWLTPFAIMALANGSTDPMTQDDTEVA